MSDEMNNAIEKNTELITTKSSEEKLAELIELVKATPPKKKIGDPANKDVVDRLSELLCTGDNLTSVVNFIEASPHIDVVITAFQEAWQVMDNETKQRLLNELTVRGSEKIFIRQIGIAKNLLQIDANATVIILAEVFNKARKEDPFWLELSNDKKATLRTHFFSNSGEWVPLALDRPHQLKPILAAFLEVLRDHESFGKISSLVFWYKLAQWIIDAASHFELDAIIKKEINARLTALTQQLASQKEWQKEILTRWQNHKPAIQVEPAMPALESKATAITAGKPTMASTNQFTTEKSTFNDRDVIVEAAATTPVHSSSAGVALPISKVEDRTIQKDRRQDSSNSTDAGSTGKALDLLKRVTSFIEQEEAEIEQEELKLNKKKAHAYLFRQLRDSVEQAGRKEKEIEKLNLKIANLEEQLSRKEKQIEAMQNTTAKLEMSSKQNEQAWMIAEEKAEQLQKYLSELRRELTAEKQARDGDHKEFAERNQRIITTRLEEFRVKLGRRLQLVFENKRRLEKHPLDEKSAQMLMNWFQELEERLNEEGIKL